MKEILNISDPAAAKAALGKLLFTYRFSANENDQHAYDAMSHVALISGKDRKTTAQDLLMSLVAQAVHDKNVFGPDTGILMVTTWLYNRK